MKFHADIFKVLRQFLTTEMILDMETHGCRGRAMDREHGCQDIDFEVPKAKWAVKGGLVVACYAYINKRSRRRGKRYDERITIHAGRATDYAELIRGGIVAAHERQKRAEKEMVERYNSNRAKRDERCRAADRISALTGHSVCSERIHQSHDGDVTGYVANVLVLGGTADRIAEKLNRILTIATEP